jgi:hypothetical protein
VETPADRIVRELEPLSYRERTDVVAKVLERVAPGRSGSSIRTANAWSTWGALALGTALGVSVWIGTHRRARLDLTTEPADATVFIDGAEVGGHPRSLIRSKPGTHTLWVTMPGYAPSNQSIVLSPDYTLSLHVKLEGSAATGFQIFSEPGGMTVWLDGEQIMGPSGPALTNFRASKIPPGRHTLELKGPDGTHRYWRQAVLIEPDQITNIHAVMTPTDPGPAPGF